MKTTNVILAISLSLAISSFTSCQKDKDETNPYSAIMQDDDESESYFDEILAEADDVSTGTTLKSGMETKITLTSGTRDVVTSFSGDTVIKTITFTNFVNGHSDRVKNGIIIIKMLGRPADVVFKRIITMVNFSIDNNPIEGIKVIEKTAENQFTVTLTGGKITFSDGTFITRAFSHIRTQTAGMDTPHYIWDDEFTVTGDAAGINRKGNSYTRHISSPLIIKNACRWIVQGTIEITVGENEIILDYGTGECDRIATITINGVTTEIKLRGGNM